MRRSGATFKRTSAVTSCAMDRDGLSRVSDFAREDNAAGLWMKERRLSETGVCGAVEGR